MANRWHKAFANRISRGLTQGEPIDDLERAEDFACCDTEDFCEGYQAFLEKRALEFRGR